MSERQVVVTGLGVVCPLGLTAEELFDGLCEGTSGVAAIESFTSDGLPLHHAAEARCFSGAIADFGELEAATKKVIRKGLKVMCRESQMAVAAAQRALHDAGNPKAQHPPERFGCVFGSDYMLTLPEDFTAGIVACRAADGSFDYDRWAGDGMLLLNPLWLLKYLPNMPASHIAIFNDLRGPSNSLTVREASGHLAVAEACVTIQRGMADIMVAGATGTRVHPMKTVHALQTEQVALDGPDAGDPATWSRPFDRDRRGMVQVAGHAAATAVDRGGGGRRREALRRAIAGAVAGGGIGAGRLGHIHAQGLSTATGDRAEAAAVRDALGEAAGSVPTVAAKSHFGNLGAGSGLVEAAASILAMERGELFPVLNHQTPDPDCPIRPARRGDPAGGSFVSAAVTPQGQAGALVFRR